MSAFTHYWQASADAIETFAATAPLWLRLLIVATPIIAWMTYMEWSLRQLDLEDELRATYPPKDKTDAQPNP